MQLNCVFFQTLADLKSEWPIIFLFFATGLSGLLFFFIGQKHLEKVKEPGLNFALGTLGGSIIFHLIPDFLSHEESGVRFFLPIFLAGFGFMFLLKFLKRKSALNSDSIFALILGDSIHNAVTSFIWVSVSLAAESPAYMLLPAFILHEIPHKLGNFGIMIFSGLSRKKALMLSAVSASFFFAGISLRFMPAEPDLKLLLPLVSGLLSFTFISGIFRAEKNQKFKSQLVWLAAGFILMGLLTQIFPNSH